MKHSKRPTCAGCNERVDRNDPTLTIFAGEKRRWTNGSHGWINSQGVATYWHPGCLEDADRQQLWGRFESAMQIADEALADGLLPQERYDEIEARTIEQIFNHKGATR
jgi:hypothetical protein